ncbi:MULTISPECIES: transcriptional regulator [unclassified Streptomyces]|uniref:transcriptional regulator n=1 Tax=unclassified Streptomyces TaxID=2593676 RepID=UPI002E2D57D1|nr:MULTISPECIES: transcriptional regulator [unclassified Streptomyces]
MSTVAASAAALIPAPRASVDGDTVAVLPGLFVPEASQWLTTTTGRVALDGYSWMQAVHWVAGAGLYEPRRHRSHGPRTFGVTTVRVAQELAQLSPCRPGIKFLMRRVGLSERAVQDHLRILRETGLLAWIVRGTRVAGNGGQASEFARMIPVEFDVALGIRTVQRDEDAPAYTRAVSGIAESGRELIARLAKKASRKVRKPRPKTSPKASARGARESADQGVVMAVSGENRCTPMQVGTSSFFSAGTTSLPSESKLASGEGEFSISKKSKGRAGGRRGLNRVGRRFQLAGELVRQVPWMGRASVPRIAWILSDVADAGWTADEVIAFLELGDAPERVHRPSGFVAARLATAVAQWPTAEGRARAVQAYRDSRRAEQARHREWEGQWQAPRSDSVRRLATRAFIPRQHQPADDARGEVLPAQTGIDDLDQEQKRELRVMARGEFARGETTLVIGAVETFGQAATERLYGADLVQRALRLTSGRRSSLMALGKR